jgi:hypothetical protein
MSYTKGRWTDDEVQSDEESEDMYLYELEIQDECKKINY